MSSKSSTTESSSKEPILVGIIHRAHGIRGEVAVEPLSDRPERFAVGTRLILLPPGGAPREVLVESARANKRGLLVRFDGVETRDQAEGIRGARLAVEPDAVPPRSEGEFYYFELIGCECRLEQGERLGVVTDVREDGGGEMLEIRGDSGSLLVPFVKRFLVSVDPERQQIVLDLPDGLIETCTSKS